MKKAKNYSRKALSMLLAVIMIVSTCTCAFGLTASATSTQVSDLASALKCTAMVSYKAQTTVRKVGTTDNGSSSVTNRLATDTYEEFVQMKNILSKVQDAIMHSSNYKGSSYTKDGGDLKEKTFSNNYTANINLKSDLKTAMGETDYKKYGVEDFINFVVMNLDDTSSAASNRPLDGDGHTTKPNYTKITFTVGLTTTDCKGYVKSQGFDKLSSMQLGYMYQITMKRVNWSYWFDTYYQFVYDNVKAKAASPYAGPITDFNDDISTFKTYMNTLKADYPTLDSIDKTCENDQAQFAIDSAALIKAKNTLLNNTNYSVESEQVQNEFLNNVWAEAVDYIQGFANAVYKLNEKFAQGWAAYQTNMANYGKFDALAFDRKTIESDYETFKTDYYSKITSMTDEIAKTNLIKNYNLSEDYYTNFTNNVNAYQANDTKIAADAVMNDFNSVDASTLTDAEKVQYASEVIGYVNALKAHEDVVESAIVSDYTTYYDFYNELQVETNSSLLYFVEKDEMVYADQSTQSLVAMFDSTLGTSEYDRNASGLSAFEKELSAATDAASAAKALADIKAKAASVKTKANAELAARFTEQVEYAYDIFEQLGISASDLTSKLTSEQFIRYYNLLKNTVGSIDSTIYQSLNTRSVYTSTVDSETRAHYTELNGKILTAFEEFKASYGFDNFASAPEVEYSSREVYEDEDVLKTEAYDVDDAKMQSIITALDEFLTSENFKELTDGKSIADIVMPLLSNLLYTDSFINAIVNVLYPIVQTEFYKVWDTVPEMAENISEVKKLEECINLDQLLYGTYTGRADSDVDYEGQIAKNDAEGNFVISPSFLAKALEDHYAGQYLDNVDMLKKAGYGKNTWTNENIYDAETGKLKLVWGVDDVIDNPETPENEKEQAFFKASGAALKGLEPLIGALLFNNDWSTKTFKVYKVFAEVNVIVTTVKPTLDLDIILAASANNGYVNVLGPIFDMLGYEDYKSASELTSYCTTSEKASEQIFGTLLDAVEAFLTDTPLTNVLETIPNLFYALSFDMVPALLSMLKTSIKYSADVVSRDAAFGDGVLDLIIGVLVDAIQGGVNIDVGSMFDLKTMGIDLSKGINAITGLFSMEIQNLDTTYLSTAGKLTKIDTKRTSAIYDENFKAGDKAYQIEADKEGILYYLLNYVINGLKNGDILADKTVLEPISKIISDMNLIQKPAGDVVAAVAELLNPTIYDQAEYIKLSEVVHPEKVQELNPSTGEYEELDYGFTFDKDGNVVKVGFDLYTEYWTEEKAEYVTSAIPELSEFVLETLGLFGINISDEVENLLASLYTQDNVKSLVELVQSYVDMAQEDQTIADIIEMVSPMLNIDVASIIDELDSFEVTEFEDGNREAFVENIVSFIAPVVPVLKVLLVEDEQAIQIADIINIAGYNGYNSAIVPILEAIGCVKADMTSYDELIKLDNNAFVNAILNPVLSLIDRISADPINGVLDILPNILYFIESKALTTAVENILIPVYAVLDTIRPIIDINLPIDFNVSLMLDDLLAGLSGEDFVLPSYTELASKITKLGQTQERESVTGQTYNYLVVDELLTPEFFTTMAYMVLDIITVDENIDGYLAILKDLNIATEDTALDIGDFLRGVSKLESSDMAMFLVYYMVYGADVAVEHFDEVKGLVSEQMAEILENFGGYTSGQYGEMADATDDLLSQLEGKLEDLGLGDGDSLNFFQQIVAAFKKFFDFLGSFFGL